MQTRAAMLATGMETGMETSFARLERLLSAAQRTGMSALSPEFDQSFRIAFIASSPLLSVALLQALGGADSLLVSQGSLSPLTLCENARTSGRHTKRAPQAA